MRGVFYRSDTRHPTNMPDAMFTNGFDKRDPNYANPKFRLVAGVGKAPDIVPPSAVCVTRDFQAAPLFPVSDLAADSWVYVLDLDTDGMTNTQQSQYKYVASIGRLNSRSALWPMFGQERAVNSIAPGDVVGAIFVQRQFNGGDVFGGGSFLPTGYTPNPGYTGPAGTATLAANLINPLVNAGNWLPMPAQSQGVVLSTGK